MDAINANFGKILLVLALALSAGTVALNGAQTLPEVPSEKLTRPVQVELDKAALAAASSEVYFAPGPGAQYAALERFVFVAEKKEIEFVPIELDIPPAAIMRPAQILPEPGPSLEGSHKLPRFGDEFPPIVISEQTGPGTTNTNRPPNTPGPAPTPTPPNK